MTVTIKRPSALQRALQKALQKALQRGRGALLLSALCVGALVLACEGPSGTQNEGEPVGSGAQEGGAPAETPAPEPLSCEALEDEALFERRVRPLVTEGSAPSCSRCHLPGVDFRPFVQEGECETLACLQEEGLISLEEPESSKLLAWITRGHELVQLSLEDDPLARAEHGAFLSWIQYQAQCGAERCSEPLENPCNRYLPQPEPDQGPPDEGVFDQGVFDQGAEGGIEADLAVSDAEVGDQGLDMELERMDMELELCSEERLNFEFIEEVWPKHGRCYYCHADRYSANSTQSPRPAPWMSDNREEAGALITAERLRASGYLNLAEPSQSLILLKPLSTELGGVSHGGGTKIRSLDDTLYQGLLAWIEHLASCP